MAGNNSSAGMPTAGTGAAGPAPALRVQLAAVPGQVAVEPPVLLELPCRVPMLGEAVVDAMEPYRESYRNERTQDENVAKTRKLDAAASRR